MKATEQYFLVAVWFITLYKVVLTFDPADETIKGGHSNEI